MSKAGDLHDEKDDNFIGVKIILDTDEFPLEASVKKDDKIDFEEKVKRSLRKYIRSTDALVLKVKFLHMTSTSKNNQNNLYYESSSIVRISCQIFFSAVVNTEFFRRFLCKLSVDPLLIKIYFALDLVSHERVFNELNLWRGSAVSQKSSIDSFMMGCIIGVGNFVSYFDSTPFRNKTYYFEKPEILFNNGNGCLTVKFYNKEREEDAQTRKYLRSRLQEFDDDHVHGTYFDLRVKYEALHSVIVVPSDDPRIPMEVYFNLKYPPILYQKKSWKTRDDNFWSRVDTFPLPFQEDEYSKPIPKTHEFTGNDFGRCDVLGIRMVIPKNVTYEKRCPWELLSNFKRVLDLTSPIPFHFAGLNIHAQDTSLHSDANPRDCKPRFEKQVDLPAKIFSSENFSLLYSFSCCNNFSHQFFADLTLPNTKAVTVVKETQDKSQSKSQTNGNRKQAKTNSTSKQEISTKTEPMNIDTWNLFWNYVLKEWKKSPKAVEKSFYDLFHSLEQKCLMRIEKTFKDLMSINTKLGDSIDVGGTFRIRRVFLTPTRVIFLPPHRLVSSRFFNTANPEFAMRLNIRDENGLPLSFTLGQSCPEGVEIEILRKHVKDPILKGIQVGPIGRNYKFLASSTSQMSQHGMLLYARDDQGREAVDLRNNIGDFSKILFAGKLMARMGQAFSQMIGFVQVETTVKLPDFVGGQHPQSKKAYVFSDGIGKVSLPLARDMTRVIQKKDEDITETPSAFQIRFQGCKGVLVVDPDFYPEDKVIGTRQSMDKFPSTSTSLEILKISEPRRVFLNRSIICLLEQLEAKTDMIKKLLNDSMKSLVQSLFNESSAANFIRSDCSFLHSLLELKFLSGSSIYMLSEPFFRKIIDLLIRQRLKELKERARIPIPFDSARMMFGVLDEHGVLNCGEVFVRYSRGRDSSETLILEGEVMVSRYPCMHPGDVRKFQAVNRPQVIDKIGHIKDCIVFPRKGIRPHTNEMSGGDLDGDEYAVIWMKELFFPGLNREPMIYADTTKPCNEDSERDPERDVQDILEFYCKVIQSNIVGLVANAHLAFADSVEGGIYSPICIELCRKYSIALDFPKTGINCTLSSRDRPKHYPDFMEKGSERSTYVSHSILGFIYRKICLFELAVSDIHLTRETDATGSVWPFNRRMQVKGWKQFEHQALKDYDFYVDKMSSLMKEFGAETEANLWSTFLEKNLRFSSGKKDMAETQEMLEKVMRGAYEVFRERFERGIDSMNQLERIRKASAYYVISHQINTKRQEETKHGSFNIKKDFYGFPWIVTRELALISRLNTTEDIDLRDVDISDKKTYLKVGDIITELIDIFVEKNIIPNITDRESKPRLHVLNEARNQVIKHWLEMQPPRNPLLDTSVEERFMFVATNNNSANVEDIEESNVEFSVGSDILQTLETLINKWIDDPNGKRTMQLGLDAIITMNRIFRSRSIDPLIQSQVANEENAVGDKHETLRRYHIFLSDNEDFKQRVEKHDRLLLRHLMHVSGISDITGDKYSIGRFYYWMVIARGTKWQLDVLQNYVISRQFHVRALKATENEAASIELEIHARTSTTEMVHPHEK